MTELGLEVEEERGERGVGRGESEVGGEDERGVARGTQEAQTGFEGEREGKTGGGGGGVRELEGWA